jgi:hypothetical protein
MRKSRRRMAKRNKSKIDDWLGIRVDVELKGEFSETVGAEGVSGSFVVRELIAAYLRAAKAAGRAPKPPFELK